MAGFDAVRDSTFFHNLAASSGGALVHAGVMEEISGTTFEDNGAGNEGPAIVSLGLLSYMYGVTFDGNSFYCEEGKFSTEVEIVVRASLVGLFTPGRAMMARSVTVDHPAWTKRFATSSNFHEDSTTGCCCCIWLPIQNVVYECVAIEFKSETLVFFVG